MQQFSHVTGRMEVQVPAPVEEPGHERVCQLWMLAV